MNISRRSFLGKSLKTMAVAALAPVIAPLVKTKEIQANSVLDKPESKTVWFGEYNTCDDFTANITIQDYKPGQKVEYQDLSLIEPSCEECMYAAKCTQTGKCFIKCKPDHTGKFDGEEWSRKVHARIMEGI